VDTKSVPGTDDMVLAGGKDISAGNRLPDSICIWVLAAGYHQFCMGIGAET
jgi:hypothetical protein